MTAHEHDGPGLLVCEECRSANLTPIGDPANKLYLCGDCGDATEDTGWLWRPMEGGGDHWTWNGTPADVMAVPPDDEPGIVHAVPVDAANDTVGEAAGDALGENL